MAEMQLPVAPVLCGAAAGSAMKLMDHPFDTIKTLMQVDGSRAGAVRYASTAECLVSTVRCNGVLSLYRGLPPALVATSSTSALRFGIQHYFNGWLASHMAGSSSSFERLPANARILAEAGGGAACGLVLPLIFTPLELIKVRRQVLRDAPSSLQMARRVLAEQGLRGLYVGHTLTIARSTLGNGALFGSYEAFKALFAAAAGSDERSRAVQVCAGVCSGWSSQLVCFPIDAAKSRAQAKLCGGGGSVGLLSGLRELWHAGAMYRGVSAMLLRAVPVHMVYLPLYSTLLQALAPAA